MTSKYDQSYDRRKKYLKKKEREKWSQIDYRYMTEESDSENVVYLHKLTWRSEGELFDFYITPTLRSIIIYLIFSTELFDQKAR